MALEKARAEIMSLKAPADIGSGVYLSGAQAKQ